MEKKISKHVFPMRDPMTGGMAEITSIVTDQEDFDQVMDTLDQSVEIMMLKMEGGFGREKPNTKVYRIMKHMPLVCRGTKTQWVFDRYEVATPYMSIIVRGAGQRLVDQMIGSWISQMGERV